MNIDDFFRRTDNKHTDFNSFDKGNYYLGRVSRVGDTKAVVQVENLSLMSSRILNNESIVPNTTDYLVIVDSNQGIFLGKVFSNGINDNDSIHELLRKGKFEKIFPELSIEVIAVNKFEDTSFSPSSFLSVGVHDKVYFAPNKAVSLYLKSIETEHYKHEEPLNGNFAVFANYPSIPFNPKPSTLFNRHMMIIGTTGSGKSSSSLSIIDKAINQNIKFIIIDPTGEYQNSFSEAEVDRIVLGVDTNISPGSLSIAQWINLLEASSGVQAPALMNAINSLRYQEKKGMEGIYIKNGVSSEQVVKDMNELNEEDKEFQISYLAKQLYQESVMPDKNNVLRIAGFKLGGIEFLIDRINQKFETTELRKLFTKGNKVSLFTKLKGFINGPKSVIIDTSNIGSADSVGATMIDLICRYLLENKKREQQPFVVFIDEVHRYTTKKFDDVNFWGLEDIAREGRKLGIYLLLTTQRPTDVSNTLLSQMGMLLVHRITQPDELKSIQNFLDSSHFKIVKNLSRGEAILTGVNILQDINLKIIPSKRKHMNDSPGFSKRIIK